MTSVGITPAGNQYVQTSAGKKTGAAAGAVVGGVVFHRIAKSAVRDKAVLRTLADRFVSRSGANIEPKTAVEQFTKMIKHLPKVSLLMGATIVGGLGLAIGAIVD